MKRTAIVLALLTAGCGAAPTRPAARLAADAPGALARSGPTELERHVMFFDGNGDGKIELEESNRALRRLGLGAVGGFGGALAIHVGFREARGTGWTLEIAKIMQVYKRAHSGGKGAFDAEGRFVPVAFEKMLAFDANKSGSFTWTEISRMLEADGKSLASKAEFGALLRMAADTHELEGGKRVAALSAQRLRGVYDGSLFPQLAAEREKRQASDLADGPLPD